MNKLIVRKEYGLLTIRCDVHARRKKRNRPSMTLYSLQFEIIHALTLPTCVLCIMCVYKKKNVMNKLLDEHDILSNFCEKRRNVNCFTYDENSSAYKTLEMLEFAAFAEPARFMLVQKYISLDITKYIFEFIISSENNLFFKY